MIYTLIGWNMQPLSLDVGDENWKLHSTYGNHVIFVQVRENGFKLLSIIQFHEAYFVF